MKHALILVDLQNDFVAGGALAVPEGDAVIGVANEQLSKFELVVATQDWHPPGHGSFASQNVGVSVGEVFDLNGLQQVAWPDHCVQGTSGADFVSELNLQGVDHVIQKGTDRQVDSYSGFFDNGRLKETGLCGLLKSQGIDEVSVLGLATDYCVKFTAIDAVELGFKTNLILDGCRGVELKPGDVERAIEEMRQSGVVVR
jgi:nicotinamidase/pyrazinamidase